MTQITALILRAIAAGHRYGFDVMEACGLPSGTVYPALRRLERARWVAAHWEDEEVAREAGRPARKLYTLTEEGRSRLPAADGVLASRRRLLGDMLPSPKGARDERSETPRSRPIGAGSDRLPDRMDTGVGR